MRLPFRLSAIIAVLFLMPISALAQTQATDQGNANAAPAKIGNGVSPPRPIHTPDPEYSEEARRAHFQGTCVLWLIVDPDGHTRNIRVARTLGKGLDEKAIEAVSKWRFEPARKDGQPVAVQVNVEVSFRLDGSPQRAIDIHNLQDKANKGDPQSEFELAKRYFAGQDVPKDPDHGTQLLLKAANHGYPEAQFLMGELYVLANSAMTTYWMPDSIAPSMAIRRFFSGLSFARFLRTSGRTSRRGFPSPQVLAAPSVM